MHGQKTMMPFTKDIDDYKSRYDYLTTKLNRKLNRKINGEFPLFEAQKMEIRSKLERELDAIEGYLNKGDYQEAQSHSVIALWYIKIMELK
jgi:hypothetical protein